MNSIIPVSKKKQMIQTGDEIDQRVLCEVSYELVDQEHYAFSYIFSDEMDMRLDEKEKEV